MATCSLFSELEYIEPGHLLGKAVKEPKKNQKGDIPFIWSPSFFPIFPATVKIKKKGFNANSEEAR